MKTLKLAIFIMVLTFVFSTAKAGKKVDERGGPGHVLAEIGRWTGICRDRQEKSSCARRVSSVNKRYEKDRQRKKRAQHKIVDEMIDELHTFGQIEAAWAFAPVGSQDAILAKLDLEASVRTLNRLEQEYADNYGSRRNLHRMLNIPEASLGATCTKPDFQMAPQCNPEVAAAQAADPQQAQQASTYQSRNGGYKSKRTSSRKSCGSNLFKKARCN